MELNGEVRHDDNIGNQVPVDDSGNRSVGRLLYHSHTHRGLKSRHVQFIALGGSIGTGLFVGTGTTLSLAGPAPLFMCTSPYSCFQPHFNNGDSFHCQFGYRLVCTSKPGRDDNLPSGPRSLRTALCPPLLRDFLGFRGWLELLVFIRYAGGC